MRYEYWSVCRVFDLYKNDIKALYDEFTRCLVCVCWFGRHWLWDIIGTNLSRYGHKIVHAFEASPKASKRRLPRFKKAI